MYSLIGILLLSSKVRLLCVPEVKLQEREFQSGAKHCLLSVWPMGSDPGPVKWLNPGEKRELVLWHRCLLLAFSIQIIGIKIQTFLNDLLRECRTLIGESLRTLSRCLLSFIAHCGPWAFNTFSTWHSWNTVAYFSGKSNAHTYTWESITEKRKRNCWGRDYD